MSENPDTIRIVSGYYPDTIRIFGHLEKIWDMVKFSDLKIFLSVREYLDTIRILSGYYPDTIQIFRPDGQCHYLNSCIRKRSHALSEKLNDTPLILCNRDL